MPRIAKELSALEVSKLRVPGMHAVGTVPGLYLLIAPTGARSWILRLKVGVKRPEIGLGAFPAVTLAEAREKARRARAAVDSGKDPIEERRAAASVLKASQVAAMTSVSTEATTSKWQIDTTVNAACSAHEAIWREVSLSTYSSRPINLGEELDQALIADDIGQAAKVLCDAFVHSMLNGIQDPTKRAAVLQAVKRRLTLCDGVDAGAEAFPGACIEEIGSVYMPTLLGKDANHAEHSVWKWLETNACFEHKEHGKVDGVRELVLNLSMSFSDIPDELDSVLKRARHSNLSYLVFHDQ